MTGSKTILLLALAALCAGGCMSANSLNPLAQEIEDGIPGAHFDPGFQMTLGRISLGLTRAVVPEETKEEDLSFLKDVKKVEIAVYETGGLPSSTGEFTIPGHDRFKRRGWQTLVTATDRDGGGTWVLSKNDKDGQIGSLLVGSLDGDELVLVKIRGRIEEMIRSLQEDGVLDVPGIVQADVREEGHPVVTVEASDG